MAIFSRCYCSSCLDANLGDECLLRMDNYEIWPDDEYGEYFDYYVPTAAQYQRGLIYGVPTIIGMQSEYGKWAL